MKVLYLDIETRAAEVSTWGLFNQNIGINQVKIPTSMISFAAKWQGKRKAKFYSDFHDGHENMVRAAHGLVDAADVLVTWNGRSFDEKHLNREFLEAGLRPPSPYASLDLMLATRRKFRFLSNKLQWVSTQLGLQGKVGHEGFDLWSRCLAGDPEAWALMRKYNVQDVVLLEDLHKILLPWIDGHPSVAAYDGVMNGCPNCGGIHLQSRGYVHTKQSRFRRLHCQDCGKWSRSTLRQPVTSVVAA